MTIKTSVTSLTRDKSYKYYIVCLQNITSKYLCILACSLVRVCIISNVSVYAFYHTYDIHK